MSELICCWERPGPPPRALLHADCWRQRAGSCGAHTRRQVRTQIARRQPIWPTGETKFAQHEPRGAASGTKLSPHARPHRMFGTKLSLHARNGPIWRILRMQGEFYTVLTTKKPAGRILYRTRGGDRARRHNSTPGATGVEWKAPGDPQVPAPVPVDGLKAWRGFETRHRDQPTQISHVISLGHFWR